MAKKKKKKTLLEKLMDRNTALGRLSESGHNTVNRPKKKKKKKRKKQ